LVIAHKADDLALLRAIVWRNSTWKPDDLLTTYSWELASLKHLKEDYGLKRALLFKMMILKQVLVKIVNKTNKPVSAAVKAMVL
jgi:hypothetical protein